MPNYWAISASVKLLNISHLSNSSQEYSLLTCVVGNWLVHTLGILQCVCRNLLVHVNIYFCFFFGSFDLLPDASRWHYIVFFSTWSGPQAIGRTWDDGSLDEQLQVLATWLALAGVTTEMCTRDKSLMLPVPVAPSLRPSGVTSSASAPTSSVPAKLRPFAQQ